MNKDEILFVSIKSDVSACICEVVCLVSGKIKPETLNEMANKYTDRIISTIKENHGPTNN